MSQTYARGTVGDFRDVAERLGLDTGDETRTQQSFKSQVDVNNIVKRFAEGGIAPQPPRTAVYADFTGADDLQSAMERVAAAQEAFRRLPVKVRAEVGHSPAELLRQVEEPEALARLQALGLEFGEPAEEPAASPAEPPSGQPPTSEPVGTEPQSS